MIRVNIHIDFIEWNLDVKESEWNCQNCGVNLNSQSSFNSLYGMTASIVCEECGYENELSVVSSSNTLPSSEDIFDIDIDNVCYIRDYVSEYLENKYGFTPINFVCDYEEID